MGGRPLQVVCWLWPSAPNYRSKFTAEHVNTLRNMVARHYHKPHEFVCITNIPKGIDPSVRIVPLWDDFASVSSPHGATQPACYRRLRAFASDMRDVIGPRFISLDLDVVITNDVSPIFDRTEDFIIWNSPLVNTPYNGSMWMMNAGAREEVYTKFHPIKSPQYTKRSGMKGSDQAWFTYVLGPNEAVWTKRDGVYSYRDLRNTRWALPKDARIVFFAGHIDPWSRQAYTQSPWIHDHYF